MKKLSQVSNERGAPMGRPDSHGDYDHTHEFSLERIHLVDGAYDEGGAYWGGPDDLYQVYAPPTEEDDEIEFYIRAESREEAEQGVKDLYPNVTFKEPRIGPFEDAYIAAALWCGVTKEDGMHDGDDLTIHDIDADTLDTMVEDCHDFKRNSAELLEKAYAVPNADYNLSHAGHDFWLTRNRNGAGFWDRGLGEVGAALTEVAHAYGGRDLFLDTDGKVKGGM